VDRKAEKVGEQNENKIEEKIESGEPRQPEHSRRLDQPSPATEIAEETGATCRALTALAIATN
jgi:hypothetical protein